MPCYSPLTAYQTGNGDVIFVERMGKGDVRRELSLSCGQCLGCRLERSRQWAMRCMHEASLHKKNAFITLTYSDEYLPNRGCLHYPDYQKFMKRLQKYSDGGIRFYMCGEYGEQTWRPHYHACLFGVDFPDRIHHATMESGFPTYRSDLLERLWPFGNCWVGDVSFESAGYVARYCVQKVTGKNARFHYSRWTHADFGPVHKYQLVPEFNKMSLKPGIGDAFYRQWKDDIYPHDYVVVRGQKMPPAKYYNKLFARENPDVYEELQWKREAEGRRHWEDNTPERLIVKETVQRARAAFLKRTLNG